MIGGGSNFFFNQEGAKSFMIELGAGTICFNISAIQPDLGANLVVDWGSFVFVVESLHVLSGLL